MTYQPLSVTSRIRQIKALYASLPVPSETDPYQPNQYRSYRSGDRLMTLGYLHGWDQHFDAPTNRLRTSYAEAQELYESQPQIFDHELLLGHIRLPTLTEKQQMEYDTLADSYRMSPHTLLMRGPRKDHLGLDLEKLLRLGINGLREEIQAAMKALDTDCQYPDLEALKKGEFYQCCMIELDAVSDLAARYSQRAFELAQTAPHTRGEELRRLGQMLRRVPDEPATTFYEAVQSIHFFLSTLFGLYPLGRPDRYLLPYYQRDIANGTLTRELAQELIDNFCLGVSDRVFTRAACGFIVGGRDATGKNVDNELTYMFLTALEHLRIPDPNGALAVNRDTEDALLAYATEILGQGVSHPAFYNDDAIIRSLIENYGVTPEDAVNYIHSTCAEITVIGKSKGHTTPFTVDLPRLLQETVDAAQDAESFDALFEAFMTRLQKTLRQETLAYAIRILEGARFGNEAMRACALIDDCIARGKSIYEGGERYTFFQPVLVGFATVTDSLMALKQLVYTDRKLSLADINRIVHADFENAEPLRQYIIHKIPHYGNDHPEADALAKRLADGIMDQFRDGTLPLKKHMMPGTFSYVSHATKGREMGATFDGRRAGYAYSDGCSAAQGRDTHGPTAMILSLTSWEQAVLLGGMVVNIKFGKENLSGEKSRKFITLLRTFIARGGIELQVNAVDRQTLEAARLHPEQHADLMVRIGGYSDYFIRLTPTLQQEIIDRTEY